MASNVQSTIRTLSDVLSMMAPFAGGQIPDSSSNEYTDWVRWINQKQEEYARRAFWRRCLTREQITLDAGFTTVLPDRFHKPNGLYMLIVENDEGENIDWNDPDNEDLQDIAVEMITDSTDDDFGSWQMRFGTELTESTTAILWYFANPPKVSSTSDILLLPGDMIGYAALIEYFRTTGAEGSEDRMEELAENRFQEYLSLEVIPDPSDLLNTREKQTRTDRLVTAKAYYSTRDCRHRR